MSIISIEEARHYLRVEHEEDDAEIGQFIEAAISHAEAVIGRTLPRQAEPFVTMLNGEPPLALPEHSRVSRVEGLWRKMGTWEQIPLSSDNCCEGWSTRDGFLHITGIDCLRWTSYRVFGVHGGQDFPPAIRQACLFLIGHFYEHRTAVLIGQGVVATKVPLSVANLLEPYRESYFA